MPLSDTYTYLPVDSIIIHRDERQRKKIETYDLQKSIKQIGLINPIIVRREIVRSDSGELDETYHLVAGERRLEAYKALNGKVIPVRFADSLSPIESSIIELEENIKREDLDWRDRVKAISKIHQLHLSLDPGWTMGETAESVSLALSTISLYLRVGADLTDPRIHDCGTVREAYNVLARRDQRQMGNVLSDLLEEAAPPEVSSSIEPLHHRNGNPNITRPELRKEPTVCQSILHESFLNWAPRYTGPKFNLIHVDFPYGIDAAAGRKGLGSEHTAYQEDPETFNNLLECFCINFNRFASISCHIIFWYSAKRTPFIELLQAVPSVEWYIHPLIWLRTDNSGFSSDPRRRPRHLYETCLFGSRGDRNLVRSVADAYASPGDRSLHPHTKPEPMLRHFFQMVVDEHTSLFDPTCGSGSALRAAESLGASKVLGLESDWDYAEAARKALKDARQLRRLTRS